MRAAAPARTATVEEPVTAATGPQAVDGGAGRRRGGGWWRRADHADRRRLRRPRRRLLTPEQTEGPFYLPGDLVRRDITEGLPGRPLRLGIRVVERRQPVAARWSTCGTPTSRRLLGVRRRIGQRGGRRRGHHVPARLASGRRRGHRRVRHRLPGLVPGAGGPHPREGPPRRHHGADLAALLQRGHDRRGARPRAVRGPRHPRYTQRGRPHRGRPAGSRQPARHLVGGATACSASWSSGSTRRLDPGA